MQAMLPDADVFSVWYYDRSPHLEESDLIFVLSDVVDLTDNVTYWEGVDQSRIKPIPSFGYYGFHPDPCMPAMAMAGLSRRLTTTLDSGYLWLAEWAVGQRNSAAVLRCCI